MSPLRRASTGRRTAAVALAVSALASGTVHAETAPAREWVTEYSGGDLHLREGADVRIILVDDGSVSLTTRGRSSFWIPPHAIVSVTRDNLPFRPVKAWGAGGLQGIGELAASSASAGPVGAVVLLMGGVVYAVGALVLAPITVNRHYVGIVWDDGGARHTVVVKVWPHQEAEITAALEARDGVTTVDLQAERKRLHDEIEAHATEGVPLILDAPGFVVLRSEPEPAAVPLRKGEHRALVLERGPDRAEVFFFRGEEVRPDHPEAVAAARLEPASETDGAVVRSDGVVASIVVRGRRAVFATVPEVGGSSTSTRGPDRVRAFYGRPGISFVATRSGDGDAVVIRMHVIRTDGVNGVPGTLEIRRDQVAFVPIAARADKGWVIARGALREVRARPSVRAGGARSVVVTTDETTRYVLPRTRQALGLEPMVRGPDQKAQHAAAEFLVKVLGDFDDALRLFD